ncbi:MAG: MFS transporter [Chloroflexi bacterium]|nr:MFS transporter [Chloroflexota bacterium]
MARPWPFFGMAAFTVLMSAIDSTIVAVALPTLVRDLDTTLVWAAWTFTAYMLAQTIMLPLAGKLAEQFGQMRVFVGSVMLFTTGSALCSVAPNIYVLIGCRILQAVGAGGFFPSATGIVAHLFPRTRSRMIGLFASIYPIGGILGPNVGGFVIEHFGWRLTFLITVPIGICVALLLLRQALAPPATSPSVSRKIDVLGIALFSLAIVAVLVALTILGNNPSFISSPIFWLLLAGSLVLTFLFVKQEQRAPEPILDLSLVNRHPFMVANVFNVLTGACFTGFFSFIPYYATVQYGMGPLESGAILTPRSLVMIAVSTTVSFTLPRLGYRMPMLAGMLCVTSALTLLGVDWQTVRAGSVQIDPLLPLLGIMALSGLGMGMLIPASNNANLDMLPQRAAVLSGIRGLFHNTGGVLGTAIIVLWLALNENKALGMQWMFIALGAIMLLALPLIFLIPDAATERKRTEARAARERAEAELAAARRAPPEPEPESELVTSQPRA